MLKFFFIGAIALSSTLLNGETLPLEISGKYSGHYNVVQKTKIPIPPTKEEVVKDKEEEKKEAEAKKEEERKKRNTRVKKGPSNRGKRHKKEGKKKKRKTKYTTTTTYFRGVVTFILTSIKHKNKKKHEWKVIMNITNRSKGKTYKAQEVFNLFQSRNKLVLTPVNEKKTIFTTITELMLNNILTRKLLIDTEKSKNNSKKRAFGEIEIDKEKKENRRTQKNSRGIILIKLKRAKKRPDNITDIFVTESNKREVKLAGNNTFLYTNRWKSRNVESKQSVNFTLLRENEKLTLSTYNFTLKTNVIPRGCRHVNLDIHFNLERVK